MSASYLKKTPNDIPLTITISNVVLASCAPAFLKLYVQYGMPQHMDAPQACSFEMGHFRPRDDPSGRQLDTSPPYLWSPLNLDSSAPQASSPSHLSSHLNCHADRPLSPADTTSMRPSMTINPCHTRCARHVALVRDPTGDAYYCL